MEGSSLLTQSLLVTCPFVLHYPPALIFQFTLGWTKEKEKEKEDKFLCTFQLLYCIAYIGTCMKICSLCNGKDLCMHVYNRVSDMEDTALLLASENHSSVLGSEIQALLSSCFKSCQFLQCS